MKQDPKMTSGCFPSAAEDLEAAKLDKIKTPQVKSSSYRLAYDDQEFILRQEMRPARLLLELSKTELVMNDHQINRTVAIFGSARIIEPEKAKTALEEAEKELLKDVNNPALKQQLKIKQRDLRLSEHYHEARELAKLITEESERRPDETLYVITGGGPGIMEAANRGAFENGGKTIGLNITLPKEQSPNRYVTPMLCLNFHYFAMRKMHFLLRATALVVFPGGFGTLDELFETLTIVQTKKIKSMPILLFDRVYWENLVNWNLLLEEGMIAEEDLSLFTFVETAQEAWEILKDKI